MRFLRRCTFMALLVSGDESTYFAEVFGRVVLIVGLAIVDYTPRAVKWLRHALPQMQ